MDVSVFLRKKKSFENRRTGNKQKKKNTLDSQQQIVVFAVYVYFCAYVCSDIFVYLKVFKSKHYH